MKGIDKGSQTAAGSSGEAAASTKSSQLRPGNLPATTEDPSASPSVSSFDPAAISPELRELYSSFQSCLDLRDKYMRLSRQRLEDDPRSYDGEFWCDDVSVPPAPADGDAGAPNQQSSTADDGEGKRARAPFPPWKIYPEPPRPHWEPGPSASTALPDHAWKQSALTDEESKEAWKKNEFRFEECEVPGIDETRGGGQGWDFEMDDKGVYQVYDPTASSSSTSSTSSGGNDSLQPLSTLPKKKRPLFFIPSIKDYFLDLEHVLSVISDGPAKSVAWRRLKYLESKWGMYALLNEYQELADMKRVPHRYACSPIPLTPPRSLYDH